MLVHEVMTGDPVSIQAEDHVKVAVDRLAHHRISCLPVVDEVGLVCGVVTEIDLIRDGTIPDVRARLWSQPAHFDAPRVLVSEVMSSPAITVHPDMDVADVVKLMDGERLKSVPVVDRDHRLVGVISRSDVLRSRARDDADVAEDLLSLFREMGHHAWSVEVSEGMVRITGPVSSQDRTIAVVAADTVPGVVAVEVV